MTATAVQSDVALHALAANRAGVGYFDHRKAAEFRLSLLVQAASLLVTQRWFWGSHKCFEPFGRYILFRPTIAMKEIEGQPRALLVLVRTVVVGSMEEGRNRSPS
jgi:hypothetical protein